jgi:UDP-glucose 4-epimerase
MILVTGGLGYIGSHTCAALAQAGYRLVIVDNLCNSKPSVLERIRELVPGAAIEFRRADLRDRAALEAVFAAHAIDAVVHFAGLKAVGESVEKPLLYWDNNVGGTIALLEAMQQHGVRKIVFSSSATVYGEPERLPLAEDHPLRPQSPYGRTKLAIEQLLADQSGSDPDFCHASLRYFNPIGAHPSGRIGEDPRGVPNNLFPFVTQIAIGRLPKLRVFGNDYATPDGTGVRDYIHVMDLAAGHVAALRYLDERPRSITVNLGTGSGYSVLQVVHAFERIAGKAVPLEVVARRPGDVAICYADASLAARELGWHARLGLEDMCRDAWRWQSHNPGGYP